MDEIMDIDECKIYLKLSKPTIYKYVRSGALPAFKIGSSLRFHREVLSEWAKSRSAQDTTAKSGKVKE